MDENVIVKTALETIQAVNKASLNNKKVGVVGVHSLYHKSREMVEQIVVHAVKGTFPERLFSKRSPNQTDKEYQYIKDNYKQLTLPDFIDYVNTTTRPFADGNWAIEYREEEREFEILDKGFRKYVENELPIYKSLEEFIKSILPTIKAIDANGFLGIRPIELPITQNDEGEFVIDQLELIEPTVIYYPSENVIDYKEGEYYLFLSKEKSLVEYGGKMVKEGNIYDLYTNYGIYIFTQTGKKIDNTFREDLLIELEQPLPVIQLKGIPNIDEKESQSILWQSPFYYAVDLLDLVATNSNWLQFSINKCVFPMQVMFGMECDFADEDNNACDNGIISGFIGEQRWQKQCPRCHGSGLKGRISPLGVLLLQPKTSLKEGETNSTQPPLSYVEPPTESLKFIEENTDKCTIKARQILKLRNRNSVISGKEITATEVYDDAKSMNAFIKPIIDQIFYIYEFSLFHIGSQRYGSKFNEPILSYPKSYDFKSTEDYLNDLTNAIKNGLDISLIKLILFQFINSYYGDSEKTSKVFNLILSANRLFGLSQDQINMKLAKGTADKWESILNDSIYNFISDEEIKDKEFLSKDITVQVKAVQDKAKELSSLIDNASVTKIYNEL